MPREMTDLEKEAIALVNKEKQEWSTAVAFITERVAFNIQPLIRQLRKNYWGVFDEPYDPNTGRKKIWVPLTEWMCEAVVKNIDIDTKDIQFVAKKPKSIGTTALVRAVVKNKLDSMFFGEILDMMERQLAIDGTVVWKTITSYNKAKKRNDMKIIPIDILNVFIDPTADSIQDAYRFTERSLLTVDEIARMDGWMNTKDLKSFENLPRNDVYNQTKHIGSSKYRDVYELWGKIPEYLITGNKKDTEEVDGRIVVSGLDNGDGIVHLIERNESGLKPYEEGWYIKVPGRWYGRGVAEKVMMLQLWMNTIVNIRINRAVVSQLGIFKVKKGRGITPQLLSRMSSNGVITVTDQDDIQQFVMQEASQASYADEENIKGWAQRITSAYETVTGESLPASTTATGVASQSRSAHAEFVFVKEGIGMFLERWLERHGMPAIFENIKVGELIRIMGDPDELRSIDERIANEKIYSMLEEANVAGAYFDPNEVMAERDRLIENLQKSGPARYVKLLKAIDYSEYDCDVHITNEDMDVGVIAQNLLQLLQVLPPDSDIDRMVIVKNLIDLIGLDSNQLKRKQLLITPEQIQMAGISPQGALPAQTPQIRAQNSQQIFSGANVPNLIREQTR